LRRTAQQTRIGVEANSNKLMAVNAELNTDKIQLVMKLKIPVLQNIVL
jgi:hypothetical protein